MRLDHLEHNGNEFKFNRKEVKKIKDTKEIEERKEELTSVEKKQKRWMDIDNPALWNGDI